MIKLWKNKLTEQPSVCIGGVTIDFGDETPAQAELMTAITNHPDAVLQNEIHVSLNESIVSAFLKVINEEIRSNAKTIEISQEVRHTVA